MPLDIKTLSPNIFTTNPESSNGKQQWLHCHKSFTAYVKKMDEIKGNDKLDLLMTHINLAVYELMSETET